MLEKVEVSIDIRGASLHCRQLGQGKNAVLFMHGGLGLDAEYFQPFVNELANDARLIYYDHRGNGRSTGNMGESTHETIADDARDLIDALGLERVTLLGHSYGGYIAQEFALRHPTRLSGLILCSTAPAFDYPAVAMQNAMQRATPEQLNILGGAGGRSVGSDAEWRAVWNAIVSMYFHRFDPEVAADIDRRTTYRAAAYDRGALSLLPAFDVTARIPAIVAPTLALAGRHDWIAPAREGAERIAAAIPGAQSVVFEESGHFPFIEEQDQFVRVVRAWLARLPD